MTDDSEVGKCLSGDLESAIVKENTTLLGLRLVNFSIIWIADASEVRFSLRDHK